MLFSETIVREEAGQERLLHLACGMRKVRLPGRREELTLVVVKGFGQEPLMILTNLAVRRNRKSVWHVVLSYITRWRIEDVIRFVKQSYRLEDIRWNLERGERRRSPSRWAGSSVLPFLVKSRG